jgi:hypothetical protein
MITFAVNHEIGMKKILTTIILTAVLALGCTCQADAKKTEESNELIKLFESYQETTGITFYNIKGMMLKMAKSSIRKTPVGGVYEHLENICIFSMADVKKEMRTRFIKEADTLLKTYEKVVEKKEEGKENRIYILKNNDEIISEMVVYAIEEEVSIILMKGEIPVSALEDIAARAEEQEKKSKEEKH